MRIISPVEGLVGVLILLLAVAVSTPRVQGRTIARNEKDALKTLSRILDDARPAGRPAGRPAAIPSLETLVSRGIVSGEVRASGVVESKGYLFKAVPRDAPPAASAAPPFVIVAWPAVYGKTGNAAFIVDEGRECFETRNARRRYEGLDHAPPPNAASPSERVTGSERKRRYGSDGEEWPPVELPVQK